MRPGTPGLRNHPRSSAVALAEVEDPAYMPYPALWPEA